MWIESGCELDSDDYRCDRMGLMFILQQMIINKVADIDFSYIPMIRLLRGILVCVILVIVILYLSDTARQVFHRFRVHRYFSGVHVLRHRQDYIALPTITLPQVRQLICVDYRDNYSIPETSNLKIVSWNIEFGYKLSGIIKELKEIDPDVILLQEVDIVSDNAHPHCKSAFHTLAQELNMYGIFAGHHSYDSKEMSGVWGCAILSRYQLYDPHQVVFDDVVKNYGRSGIGARLIVVDPNLYEERHILVYSMHTEVCTGISTRLQQFNNVLMEMEAQRTKVLQECIHLEDVPVIIGGDLNTVGHGFARLSPFHCIDRYRWSSIGMSEAEWWQRNVFNEPHQIGYGFKDPFDKNQSTLFHAVHSAKLDWILMRNLHCAEDDAVTVDANRQSDHKMLLCRNVYFDKI